MRKNDLIPSVASGDISISPQWRDGERIRAFIKVSGERGTNQYRKFKLTQWLKLITYASFALCSTQHVNRLYLPGFRAFYRHSMQKIFVTGLALLALLLPGLAFADCNDIGTPAFQKGVKDLISLYESGQYKKAIDAAKPLFAKCKEAPSVLYYTGLAFRDQGDIENAKVYIQKASEALSKYSAEPGISRKIWYERYELEHPEGTVEAVNTRKIMIDALTTQVGEINKQIDNMRAQMESDRADKDLYIQKNHDLELAVQSGGDVTRYKNMMWTGAGIGIGGIALIVAGGAVYGTKHNDLKLKDMEFEKNNNTILNGTSDNLQRDLGIGLLSAGIGMTLIGAVMAGINGYYYTHFSNSDADNVSVNAGLGSFEMKVKF